MANFTVFTDKNSIIDYHEPTSYLRVEKDDLKTTGEYIYREYNLTENGHSDPFEMMAELAAYYGELIYPSLVYLD